MKNILMLCLIKKIIRNKMKIITSKLDKIGTYEICKIYISCFDDKTNTY